MEFSKASLKLTEWFPRGRLGPSSEAGLGDIVLEPKQILAICLAYLDLEMG